MFAFLAWLMDQALNRHLPEAAVEAGPRLEEWTLERLICRSCEVKWHGFAVCSPCWSCGVLGESDVGFLAVSVSHP